MNPLRVVMVTRRFWPLVGESQWFTIELAAQMRELGAKPTIVTAQWEPDWPKAAVMREIPFFRLPQPSAGGWGRFRYMRALARWLRHQHANYDVVYVSGMRHDAYAALGTKVYSDAPVILRAEGRGEVGDCHWLKNTRQGRRYLHRSQTANAIIAGNQAIETELTECGFDQRNIHSIPLGAEPISQCQDEDVGAVRAALGNVNADLFVPEQGCVALTVCHLQRVHQLELLVKSWRRVTESFPNAKLWIIGDGPAREALYERIVHMGLRQNIFLPGTFDDIDELMRAADFYIVPPTGEANGFAALKAMSASLPIVTHDPEFSIVSNDGKNDEVFVIYRDLDELTSCLVGLIAGTDAIAGAGRMGAQYADRHNIKQVAERHLGLFEEFVSKRHAKAS